MAYNLNQVAMITGLTTRTLRNHLKQGLLKGEKIDGNWSFTEEELDEYIADASVKQVILARQHAVVYDFLADPFKKTNRICTIMDFPVSTERLESPSSSARKSRITEAISSSGISTRSITPGSFCPGQRIRLPTS